jgi:RimJ/RimL family protein N-acetyltransferase
MELNVRVRPVMEADLPAVAKAHVLAWQQAYVGQMPQSYLDSLTPEDRLEGWRKVFAAKRDDGRFGTLVAEVDGAVAGFLSYGPARDESLTDHHEIFAVYLTAPYWSKGAGYALFRSARAVLKHAGAQKAYLWVLVTNKRALTAYRRWGGRVDESTVKTIEVGGTTLKEIAVFFDV